MDYVCVGEYMTTIPHTAKEFVDDLVPDLKSNFLFYMLDDKPYDCILNI